MAESMDTITSVCEMNEWAIMQIPGRKTIGLVPTMGYLHDGHLSLVKKARLENDTVVASVFVNPIQFGHNEDLSFYPRDPQGDSAKLEAAGVDVLFMPDAQELYGPGYETFVELERLSLPLCGKSRPGHFRGVATVVLKLFNIVQPTRAYFGSKDYQQLQVIKKMVRDLNVNVRIIGCPTVREQVGLAMSSRNAYLNPEQRKQAICLYEALMIAGRLFATREPDPNTYLQAMKDRVLAEPDARPDYISLVNPETLEDLTTVNDSALAVLAIRIGKTRLIDNMLLAESADINQ
ncbi:MAG: pantoate--beta-alanine ligase [Desulfomonilaceae bacterium]